MSVTQFLAVLRARWGIGLAVLLGTVGLVLALSLLLPKQYTSTASVLVDVKSPDPIAGMVLPGLMVQGLMATQADVVMSERVAERALRSLRLHENPALRAEWQELTEGRGEFEAWLIELLQKKLDVRPARESNVMMVAYTSPDPAFSADMANAIVKAYVAVTLELKVEPARQYNAFFDERAKELREALEKAQTRLSSYQRSKGIVATDERLDIENARLAELSSQAVALQAVAAESGGRQTQSSANADKMAEVLNNPLVGALTADLSRQQARLEELNSRLGDQHPQVTELRANIAELRARVNAESRRVSGSVRVNNSVNQGRLAQVRDALKEQQTKVLQLKGQRDEAAVLQRDIESAQRAYDAVLARVTQTSMESQNTQTNVSVLKQARVQAFPSSPKVVLNVAVAFVLGSLLAIAAALLAEQRDPRLRTEQDVLIGLQQPLMVVLPKSSGESSPQAQSRVGKIKARVLSGQPRPVS